MIDFINKEFYRNVSDYMLPRPSKRLDKSVLVTGWGEWLTITHVEVSVWE